jgi:Trypsin
MWFARPLAAFALLPVLAAACSEHPTPPAAPERPSFIINGVPTGGDFGNVGALLVDEDGDGTIDFFQCSGSLIAPTVFLTAAHCLAFLPADAQFYVSFAPDITPLPSDLIAAEAFHFDPAFIGPPFLGGTDLHDIGVVILPAGSTAGVTPLALPPLGYLDALAEQGGLRGQIFLNVGYGFDATSRGRPQFAFDGVRKVSESPFRALTQYMLGLLMNENATGLGGDCYGDSGSPKFPEGNTGLIVAITIWGDRPCRATSWDYRLDTESARAFLGQFVSLP